MLVIGRFAKLTRRELIVKAFFFSVIIASGCICAHSAEPIYEGKPERYWIDLLTNLHSYDFQTKWRQLGTNELAVLLKGIEIQHGTHAAAIRTNAAFNLSQRGDPRILLPIATNNSDPQLRMWALDGLAINGNRAVTIVMVEALRDKNAMVRKAAVGGLRLTAREKIPEELPALVRCLQDPDPDVRGMAAGILCEYYPYLPGQEQGFVTDAAFAEINKAYTNEHSQVREAAAQALKQPDPQSALEAFEHASRDQHMEQAGRKWTATLRVVDHAGQPVEGAEAWVVWRGIYEGEEPIDPSDAFARWAVFGRTDANGIFTASHTDFSTGLSLRARKAEYYCYHVGYDLWMLGQGDARSVETNRNPTVTLVLKKILQPIPMYAKQVNLGTPVFGKPVGFDLTLGDWVAPYGKGIHTDIIFTAELNKRAEDDSDYKLIVSFPKSGDGIHEFLVTENDRRSSLMSPHEAPLDGYQPQWIQTSIRRPGQPSKTNQDKDRNYFFRVRTILDENGNVKSALYGKIYGDFMKFRYYLNPTPNSLNVEFDPKQNLLKGMKSFERVDAS